MKTFVLCAFLLYFAVSIRIDLPKHQDWQTVTKLSDDEAQWDDFFRKSIKAIGDSVAKQIHTSPNGEVSIRYEDPTNPTDETVGWEITGNSDKNNKKVEVAVQTKINVDKEKNTKKTTITTFVKTNLVAASKSTFVN